MIVAPICKYSKNTELYTSNGWVLCDLYFNKAISETQAIKIFIGYLELPLNPATLPTYESNSLTELLEKVPFTSHLSVFGLLCLSKPISSMELGSPD